MFRKSRRKIVASIISALVVLFAATLSVIILTSYYDTKRQNDEMLAHYTERYTIEHLPGKGEGPDGPPPQGESPQPEAPLYQLSTFYSVAFSENGEALAIDNGKGGVYTTDDLVRIASDLLQNEKRSGRTSELTYRIVEREGYTLVAFMDNTVTNEGFYSLIRHTLIIGGIAIIICFFAADYIAYRIVKPLEENDQRQKQFVSDAGHELKTPISVISTNAELLSRQLGSNEWLDNIRYENERMGDLVTQLLDLSRAENAQVQMEELDLSRLVTGEALPFESVAYEHGLTIRSKIADGITLQGNRSQLSQLVSILLDNAIRHTDGGKEIELSLHRHGRHTVLAVENSGKEIPNEQQARLFERFYRLDEARSSEGNHYGLGLAIAKAIAEEHGGSISVACHDGKVIFTVSLPLKNI